MTTSAVLVHSTETEPVNGHRRHMLDRKSAMAMTKGLHRTQSTLKVVEHLAALPPHTTVTGAKVAKALDLRRDTASRIMHNIAQRNPNTLTREKVGPEWEFRIPDVVNTRPIPNQTRRRDHASRFNGDGNKRFRAYLAEWPIGEERESAQIMADLAVPRSTLSGVIKTAVKSGAIRRARFDNRKAVYVRTVETPAAGEPTPFTKTTLPLTCSEAVRAWVATRAEGEEFTNSQFRRDNPQYAAVFTTSASSYALRMLAEKGVIVVKGVDLRSSIYTLPGSRPEPPTAVELGIVNVPAVPEPNPLDMTATHNMLGVLDVPEDGQWMKLGEFPAGIITLDVETLRNGTMILWGRKTPVER